MGSEPSRRLERILIIGAGLAGLALAVSLRKSQYSVVVVERDTALRDVCSDREAAATVKINYLSGWCWHSTPS